MIQTVLERVAVARSDSVWIRDLQLEAAVQPMLDWVSTNHHDFMRLNDFSESFSLLRWLGGNKIAPILIDMDGEDAEIATPDRIVNGEGPRVR